MSTVRPRRRLLRPATVLLAVLAGLAIGFGADVARSGGVGAVAGAPRAAAAVPPAGPALRHRGAVAVPRLPGEWQPDGRARGRLGLRQRDLERGPRRDRRDDPDVRLRPGGSRPERRPGDAHARGRGGGPAGPARRGRARTGPSSSPATRSAARTPGCSPRPTADEVVGALLVDSFEPDIQDDRIHPLLGELQPEYEAQLDGLRAHVSRVDGLDWPASEEQLRASSFEGIPLEVLVAARYEPRLDAATNEVIADAWREGMESLSPGRTTYTIVVRRRPQHPHRTAGHGDRCRASPRRRRSRPLTARAILRSHGPPADDHRAVPHPRRRAHPHHHARRARGGARGGRLQPVRDPRRGRAHRPADRLGHRAR